ncbi:MAG: alkaline phosphatase family protein [Desulfobacteraceae bacterium]
MNHRTLLIGLDGATFTILDALMEQGIMPFLNQFAKRGVRSELISVIPPLTPPAWTSLMTGCNPGAHGIFDFFQKEKTSHRLRFTTHQDVQAKTIWHIVSGAGMRVTSLNFPLMLPPPAIAGNVISGGWLTSRQLPLACYPSDLYRRINALPGFNAKELALDMSHEEKALEGCRQDEVQSWIQMHIRREQQWFEIIRNRMQKDPCELEAILFDGIDKIQHLCWSYLTTDSVGQLSEVLDHGIRELSFKYFSELDRILAQIAELAGPEATIVLVSDHGFGAQRDTFFVNEWLERNGYLKWADKDSPWRSATGILGMGEMAKHIFKIDWDHTVAYASTPSSNGIHIVKESSEHPNGITPGAYNAMRYELMQNLKKILSPTTGDPLISKIWPREEAFSGKHVECAPDLTLLLHDGGLVSILSSDEVVKPLKSVKGSHRMEGIFLAKGPGINSYFEQKSISILDIAPILLHTLNIPIPSEMEGGIPDNLFTPAYLKRSPIKITKAEQIHGKVNDDIPVKPVFDAEAEAQMAEKLRALGYIE